MSLFGFLSLFIALLCVAIIILYHRIMSRRTPVDMYFAQLEDLLRDKAELLYKLDPTKYGDLYDKSLVLSIEDLLSALHDINEEHESLAENASTLIKTKESLLKAVDDYNAFITSNPHTILMSKILGIEVIEKVHI